MNPLIGMLASQLGGPAIQQISQQIGADSGTTQSAVGMALPMLLSAFGNIIMDEASRVDHFSDFGEATVTGGDF